MRSEKLAIQKKCCREKIKGRPGMGRREGKGGNYEVFLFYLYLYYKP